MDDDSSYCAHILKSQHLSPQYLIVINSIYRIKISFQMSLLSFFAPLSDKELVFLLSFVNSPAGYCSTFSLCDWNWRTRPGMFFQQCFHCLFMSAPHPARSAPAAPKCFSLLIPVHFCAEGFKNSRDCVFLLIISIQGFPFADHACIQNISVIQKPQLLTATHSSELSSDDTVSEIFYHKNPTFIS